MTIGNIDKKNIITIGLDITTLCNYSCEYCYARPTYGNDWQKDNLNLEDIKKLLKVCKLTNKHLIFNILGGEPTLSSNFLNILKIIKEVDSTYEVNVFTNFSKKLNFWTEDTLKNIDLIVASLHISQEKNTEQFIMKAEELSKYKKISIRLMLENNDKWINFANNYLSRLLQLNLNNNISIEIDPINVDVEKYKIVFKKFKDLFYEFSRHILIDKERVKEYDILNYIETTKDLICYHNNYVYKTSNTFIDSCSNKQYNLSELYFKFKNGNKLKCERNFCPCFYFLESYKTLGEKND